MFGCMLLQFKKGINHHQLSRNTKMLIPVITSGTTKCNLFVLIWLLVSLTFTKKKKNSKVCETLQKRIYAILKVF